MVTVQWEEVFEALPDAATENGERKRREMWAIMDLDDSLSLSMYELEKGVAVFTRSEECFDCYPAVQTAFKFTKRLHVGDDHQSGENTEEEEVVEDEEKKESEIPLFYSEFHEFLVNTTNIAR